MAGNQTVVVVSNDFRNRALPSVLVAAITSEPKPDIPTIVNLPIGEPAVGRVLCDDIRSIDKDELGLPVGRLSRRAMGAIDMGMRLALGLDRYVSG